MTAPTNVYLDHNATSPPDAEHVAKALQEFQASAGNPSSPHAAGRGASVSLTRARRAVAQAVGFDVAEIVFVSGGSEANNLGTAGVLQARGEPLEAQHAILSTVEHPSVREPLEFLQRTRGLQLTAVPVDESGFVRAADVVAALRPNTSLVTLMAANNETGAVQPVRELAQWLHRKRWTAAREPDPLDAALHADVGVEDLRRLHFHVDGVQALGKLRADEWLSPGFDSLSVCAHKLGGLSGIGAIALRRGRRFQPLVLGGAQERNRRAGTENLLGIISLGLVAGRIAESGWWAAMDDLGERTRWLRERISAFPGVHLHSPALRVLPNTLNFSVVSARTKGEDVLMELDMAGVQASSGSACSSGTNLPSRVLLAQGRSAAEAGNAIRLSLGIHTDRDQIDYALRILSVALS